MLKAERVIRFHTWEDGDSGLWWNMPLKVVPLVSGFSKTFARTEQDRDGYRSSKRHT